MRSSVVSCAVLAAVFLGVPHLVSAQTRGKRSPLLPTGIKIKLVRSSTGHQFGQYRGQPLGGHLIYGVASRRAVCRALGTRVSPDQISFLRVQTDPGRCSTALKSYLSAAGRKLDRFMVREQSKADGSRYAMDYGYILAGNRLAGLFRQGRTGRVMVVGSDPGKARVLVDR